MLRKHTMQIFYLTMVQQQENDILSKVKEAMRFILTYIIEKHAR